MIFLVAVISYILGSIPAGFIISNIIFKTDIRKLGSGNVGATNVFRNFGKGPGFVTFVFDFLKGTLACYIGKKLGGEFGQAVALFFAVLGHMYSFVLKFKAGKGVATAFGSLLAIDYRFALLLLAIFIVILLLFRIVSLASIIAATISGILGFVWFGFLPLSISIFLIASLIVYKHKSNIKRLKAREEKKIF